MNDDIFERDLRALLAARDPGPAPAALAMLVGSRLETDHGPQRLVAMGRWAGTAAVLAALAAVLILTVVVSRPTAVTPGSSPLPTPAQPYSIQPGDGVVTEDHVPVAQEIAALVALAGLFVMVRLTTDRRVRIGAILGIALIVLVTARIGTSDAIGFVGGVTSVEPGASGASDPPGMHVSVTGDRPFTIIVTITNTSRLPLTIEGLPVQGTNTVNGRTQPRLVGLGAHSVCCTATAVQPFQPTILQPDGSVDLAIGGLAGDCAVPPFTSAAQRYSSFDQVSFVYEQLTIWHTAVVTLPDAIVVSESGVDCR
jgi:hypothetical protein